jgi:hypothetical protein
MCIPPQHAQIFVAGDAGDFHDVQSLLEQPGGRLVTQVVEAEFLDTGPSGRAHVGALHRLGGDAGENIAVQGAGQGAQYDDGGTIREYHSTEGLPISLMRLRSLILCSMKAVLLC